MKHIDLIKLINENKELLDRAYKQDIITNVDEALLDINLFIKIHDNYKLNQHYLNFVDSLLNRIDYTIIFGDYEKEYKELTKLKKRFIESKNEHYKSSIIKLIEKLYIKFQNRDREIRFLILRLESENSMDIDLLIESATDTLDKIYELIDASEKIGQFFRTELRELDENIDVLLQSISVQMLEFIQNIDKYIKQINHFIVQTKNRRIQNKRFMKLANKIINEEVLLLEEHLLSNHKKLFFNFKATKRNLIKYYANDNDLIKLNKNLKTIFENFVIKKAVKKSVIKAQEIEKLNIIDIQKIKKDLNEKKSDDLFVFIKEHNELEKFKNSELIEESFKVYLSLLEDSNTEYLKDFNDDGIKVVSWV